MTTGQTKRLSQKNIFFLWLPLATTWFLMAFEGPFLQVLIARMNEVKPNLAALGVAFSILFIIESPIFMILAAATALVKDGVSYLRLRNFTLLLSLVLTIVMAVSVCPFVFDYLALSVLQLPERIAELSRLALICFLPVPFFVAYRRFYQGVLICHRYNRRVAYGTFVRIVATVLAATALIYSGLFPGAQMAAIALCVGILFEAAVVRWMTQKLICQLLASKVEEKSEALSYVGLCRYYFPLALTGVIAMASQPVLTFFMARAIFPLESLAVFPVLSNFSFVFSSSLLATHEIVISLLGARHEQFYSLRRFIILLSMGLALLQALILFTPFSYVLFSDIYGLSPSLAAFAVLPAMLILPMLLFFSCEMWRRAVLVHEGKTAAVTRASFFELLWLAIAMGVLTHLEFGNGALCAFVAMNIGRAVGVLSLGRAYRAARAPYREHLEVDNGS